MPNNLRQRRKIRRAERHERNRRKDENHKKEAWDSGRLIEENHGTSPYSPEYTRDLTKRLTEIILGCTGISSFRAYRSKIRDLIIYYSPEVEKTGDYYFLKSVLETYWDRAEELMEKIKSYEN